MNGAGRLLRRYAAVPRPIRYLVAGHYLVHILNSAFMLILNIHMRKLGYEDPQIASFTSYRFIGILLLALPFGLFLRGRRLKPWFLTAGLLLPTLSLVLLALLRQQADGAARAAFFLWGAALMIQQVCALPFIVRTADEATMTESFSLSFSTWSAGLLTSGLLIAGLSAIGRFTLGPWSFPWDEENILRVLSVAAFGAVLLYARIDEAPPRPVEGPRLPGACDWPLIGRAMLPTLIIAVGAGLTIPFINLFFFSVFGMDSDRFSLLGSGTAVLVFVSMLMVPSLKRKLGMRGAILGTQALSIAFLVVLAMTGRFASAPGALVIAAGCYMLRQPLMNMAGPMTTELTMDYVGERNRELVSALGSSIWSGSWFVSAKIFQALRALAWPYHWIFLLTAGLYALGVAGYAFLIRDYDRRRAAGG